MFPCLLIILRNDGRWQRNQLKAFAELILVNETLPQVVGGGGETQPRLQIV